MRCPHSLPLLLAGLALAAAVPARAQKLDKDDKKFLDDVKPIVLPDEEKSFRKLKDKSDRQEFQKIFWARRDPNLETPENEYRADYERVRAEVDAAYKVAGQPGSMNDCGRLSILIGKPDEVKKEGQSASPGLRAPETWTYRNREGFTFVGGQLQLTFDAECRLPPGDFGKELERTAGNRIVHPNIDFRTGKDGKLTKLADLLPKPSPARALLKNPRQDFPLQSQALFLKVQDGSTAVLGVVRGDATGMPVEEAGGKKTLRLTVAGSALDEAGKESASVERKTVAEVAPDGSFAASFRMSLRPGKYTLNAAALDEKGAKGSVATIGIEVPDYGAGELGMASIMVLRDVQDLPGGAANPDSPFAPFQLGPAQLVPYGTTTLAQADAPSFFYQVYDLKPDLSKGISMSEFLQIEDGMTENAVTAILGKPGEVGAKGGTTESYSWTNSDGGNLSVTFQGGVVASKAQAGLKKGRCSGSVVLTILKGAKPIAEAPAEPLETPIAGSVIGPVPFGKYEPGQYKVRLKVTDNVAKQEKVQELAIEIKP